MDYLTRISEIESRAQAVNMTLHELCRKSEVAYHGISRWRSGEVNPTVRVLERDLSQLEKALGQEELRIFSMLAPKFGYPRAVSPLRTMTA